LNSSSIFTAATAAEATDVALTVVGGVSAGALALALLLLDARFFEVFPACATILIFSY
jgi:hypothetical protein